MVKWITELQTVLQIKMFVKLWLRKFEREFFVGKTMPLHL